MRDNQVIENMTLLAEKLGLSIKFDEFDGKGGWCKLKGTEKIIINKRLAPKEQIRILAQILSRYPVDEQAVVPRVRQLIEDARQELLPEPESPVPDTSEG
jgi:hypothetical protein